MRLGVLLTTAFLLGCSETRCDRHEFFCLSSEKQESEIRKFDDHHLIKIAEIDNELSNPPSYSAIYEMHRRGEVRSRDAYFSYASGSPNFEVLDEMTKIFSNDWDVCQRWIELSPKSSSKQIAESCYRVFEEPINLDNIAVK